MAPKQKVQMPDSLRRVAVTLGVEKPKRGDKIYVVPHPRPIKQQTAQVKGYTRKFTPRGPDKLKPNYARIGPKSLLSNVG